MENIPDTICRLTESMVKTKDKKDKEFIRNKIDTYWKLSDAITLILKLQDDVEDIKTQVSFK